MDVAPYAVVVPLIAAGLLTGGATKLNRAIAEGVGLGAAIAVGPLCVFLLDGGCHALRDPAGSGRLGNRGVLVWRLGAAGGSGDRSVIHGRRIRSRPGDAVRGADGGRAGADVALPGYGSAALPD